MSSLPAYNVSYTCLNDDYDQDCAKTCTSLAACMACNCVVVDNDKMGGDWGQVMDVILCLMPIIFLIGVTVKSNPMPTTVSLPTAALLMFLVRLAYLDSDPLLTTGAVVLGVLEAMTPLSIMAGAITLFESMQASYCLPYMMREIKALTKGHPIAEMMLVFCFAYMVEGASGFGTPVALGAPILVSVGHPALESVVVLLIMNTFATVWGAVGTPIWYGLGTIGTPEEDFLEISYKAAIALGISAYILMPFVLSILVPFSVVKQNIVFVMASLSTCIIPSVAIAFFSYEFPSLIGGIIGCFGTALVITFKIGLKDVLTEQDVSIKRSKHDIEQGLSVIKSEELQPEQPLAHDATSVDSASDTHNIESVPEVSKVSADQNNSELLVDEIATSHANDEAHLGPRKSIKEGYIREVIMRTLPIWMVVLILVLTRVQQIGLKVKLTQREPYFDIHFGTLGTFRLSSSVVFQLRDIMTYPGLSWKYELLYVPFLIPFVAVSALTLFIYRKDLQSGPTDIARTVVQRLKNPAIALLGALSLVQLMIRTGQAAPATILGTILSQWFKEAFIVISPLLGALGSFFSGSTTVSNLTFGSIQTIAARSIGTSTTTMLALQAVGGSAGNGICLNNIIAACAVVGLNVGEGEVLKRTCKLVFANTTIATIVMLVLFFRF